MRTIRKFFWQSRPSGTAQPVSRVRDFAEQVFRKHNSSADALATEAPDETRQIWVSRDSETGRTSLLESHVMEERTDIGFGRVTFTGVCRTQTKRRQECFNIAVFLNTSFAMEPETMGNWLVMKLVLCFVLHTPFLARRLCEQVT